MNTKELHSKALSLVANYRKAEAELIEIFLIMDQRKSFRDLGFTSLFLYATQGLGLSEGTAYNLILVARKARAVPELKQEIELGHLSVDNARRIAPILTPENKNEWIEKAEKLPQKKLEQEIARDYPKQETKETLKYVSAARLELKVGISEGLQLNLKRVQDIESQRTKKAATLEDALEALVALYLERNDPVRAAERIRQKKLGARQVKHEVYARDQGRCTAVDPNGKRCASERWIDIHHIRPKSHGGDDAPMNLITLCRPHHQMTHARPPCGP